MHLDVEAFRSVSQFLTLDPFDLKCGSCCDPARRWVVDPMAELQPMRPPSAKAHSANDASARVVIPWPRASGDNQ